MKNAKTKKTENIQPISLQNEDGSMKSKEEFLKAIEEIYDEAAEKDRRQKEKEAEQADDCCTEEIPYSICEAFIDPENQIDEKITLDTFDFATRVIYITDEIEHISGKDIIRKIRFWNRIDSLDGIAPEDRVPIKIYINTPGGDVQEVFNIISAIKMSKTPIHTITYGCGYSGGFFIGICGHKRFGFANSSYLFHEGMTIDGGDAHKFLQHVDHYKFQLKRIKSITVENTKITPEEYDTKHKDDWFFTPAEALHYGVIDEILNDFGGPNE